MGVLKRGLCSVYLSFQLLEFLQFVCHLHARMTKCYLLRRSYLS